MKSLTTFVPVILSGGAGTRLWPSSRKSHPKQFSYLFEPSLFARTHQRLSRLGSPWVITHESLKVLTEKELPSTPKHQIVFEPEAKNTAPAIAIACHLISQHFKPSDLNQIVVGFFPSDHLIKNESAFFETIRTAADTASHHQAIVTLGLKPTYAATGFGYIETDAQEQGGVKRTLRFREKPDASTAQKFLESGNFFWNSGMFVMSLGTAVQAFKSLMPELWKTVSMVDSTESKSLNQAYSKMKSQSFDFGIMEHFNNQLCIPCDLGWSDVGSWDEVAEHCASSRFELELGSSNRNWVHSERVTALVNVDDLIVVDTADALLITKRGESQHVKKVVDELLSKGSSVATTHSYEIRPWGKFEVLRDTTTFKSKVITVDPGHKLSYQSHAMRAEHWIIVEGTAEVTLDDVIHQIPAGKNIFIPQGAKHRVKNPSSDRPLVFVEVQVGSYFGEDDIVRYQDDYSRT